MTDNYKNELRDYLTGKLNISPNSNDPQFLTPINITNNLYSYISDNTVQPATSSYKIIKGKNTNNQYLDFNLLLGLDEYDNSSFIVILDRAFNPWQFINSYSSGTKFGFFEELIVDDDGRFYGVEYVNGTGVRRFVMLNNILTKINTQTPYKVVLRQSYNLPASLQTGTIKKLIKKPLGNKYLFCATTSSDYPLAVEFTINVGESNDWIEYTYTDNNCGISGAWASWDADDNMIFKLSCTYTDGVDGYLYILTNGESDILLESQYSLPDPTADWIQTAILNESAIYLSFCTVDDDLIYNQYIYKVDGSLNLIFKSPNTDVAMPGALIKSDLYTDGYNVFISFNVPNDDDTIDYYMGIIYNDVVYYINFGALSYVNSSSLYATNTFHQFNLYSYYLQLGDTCYVSNSIFNPLEYNGLPYSDISGLVPNSAILYGSYHIPVFARNLYNKTVNDNVTVSTIEVPNNMLNLVNIAEQELFGETNIDLVDNIESIITNEYETLNINFYNTITMKNSNNPSNEIMNSAGAIRINQSSSNIMDYFDSQATKVRINYTDGTNYIIAIDPSTQITVNNNIATYSFIIYAPTNKTIKDLEIISYDEATSYVVINGNFTQDKYYRITQDVYVE